MLEIREIDNGSLASAAPEVINNFGRLVSAGYFEAGWRVIEFLILPGSWRVKRYGLITQQVENYLPLISWLNQKPCPAFGSVPARDVSALNQWASKGSQRLRESLQRPVRRQLRPAGENWSVERLAVMADNPASLSPEEIRDFMMQAEFLLKYRLHQSFSSSTSLPAENHLIAVARHAHAFSTLMAIKVAMAIADAHLPISTYDLQQLLCAAFVLSIRDGNDAAAMTVAAYLSDSPNGWALASYALLPEVRDWLAKKRLASLFGISDADVSNYLVALSNRKVQSPTPTRVPDALPHALTPDLNTFLQSISGTSLSTLEFVECAIPDSVERAFVALLPDDEAHFFWQEGRRLLDKTGRWPLVTGQFQFDKDWREVFSSDSAFARNEYTYVPEADDVRPEAILHAASEADLAYYLSLEDGKSEPGPLLCCSEWTYELGLTQDRCGCVPDEEEIKHAMLNGQPIITKMQQERWLMDWELSHGWDGTTVEHFQDYLQDMRKFLIFLPCRTSWDSLAYLHWYGSYPGSQYIIALGRQWERLFGAELMAHYGTILECEVASPPQDKETALELARQRYVAAQCTLVLPGFDWRGYAMGLMRYRRWILHERP